MSPASSRGRRGPAGSLGIYLESASSRSPLCTLGGGVRSISAEANLQRLFLPLVRERSECEWSGRWTIQESRSTGSCRPTVWSFLVRPLSGCLLVLRSVFRDTVTHPGSCCANSPVRFAACVAWRAGAALGGCSLVADRGVTLRGEGVAPKQWVPAPLPSSASFSVSRGPDCAIVVVGDTEGPPHPRLCG